MPETEIYLIVEIHKAPASGRLYLTIGLGSLPILRGGIEWTEELKALADAYAKRLMDGPIARSENETYPVKLRYESLQDEDGKRVIIR